MVFLLKNVKDILVDLSMVTHVHIQLILFLQYCTPEKYLCELDILSAMVLFTLRLKSQNNAVHGRRNVSKSLWRLPTH